MKISLRREPETEAVSLGHGSSPLILCSSQLRAKVWMQQTKLLASGSPKPHAPPGPHSPPTLLFHGFGDTVSRLGGRKWVQILSRVCCLLPQVSWHGLSFQPRIEPLDHGKGRFSQPGTYRGMLCEMCVKMIGVKILLSVNSPSSVQTKRLSYLLYCHSSKNENLSKVRT